MIEGSLIDWSAIFAVSKPLGIIGGFLGGIYLAAWALFQRSNLIKRDVELNKDDNALKLDNEVLQARYNLMVSRSQTLESHVKFLAMSIVNMGYNVEALSNIISSLIKDNQQNKPLLVLVKNTTDTFERVKNEAEKMIIESNKQLEYLKQQTESYQDELTDVQKQLATRRENNEE